MKIQKLLIILFTISFFSTQSIAQLKVNSAGELFMIGGHNINFQNSGGMEQDPGDIIFLNGENEMARIYASITTLRFRGSNGGLGGIRMNVSTENVGIKSVPSLTYEFYVTGDSYATSGWYGSDYRYKKNIKYLNSEYAHKLLQLNGASYNIKTVKENSIQQSNNDSLSLIENDTASIILNEDFYSRTRLGFIAQEVQEIYPELVKEDEDGYLAVNYDGFIPILLELIKNQQAQINELEAKIVPGNGENLKGAKLNTEDESAALFQNAPNPFSENTEIRFFLPKNIQSATLYIYNMQGTQINNIVIEQRGDAKTSINGSELNAGMYMYTLVADGKEIDTKKMILTD